MEQLIREDRLALLRMRLKRSAGAFLSSKDSTTPPVKSVMASDVLPPFSAS